MTDGGWGWLVVGGGFVATCWAYVKAAAWRCTSLLIVRAKLEGEVGEAVLFYCWRHFTASPFGEKRYGTLRAWVRPLRRVLAVGFERNSDDAMVFWRGCRPLSLSSFDGDIQKPGAPVAITITFVRGLFALDRLLVDSLDEFNEDRHVGQRGERFAVERQFGSGPMRVRGGVAGSMLDVQDPTKGSPTDYVRSDYRLLRWARSDVGSLRDGRPWESLSFPPEVECVIQDLRRWKQSEDWYKNKGIPWRYGVCLYGLPGTGKSSFAKAAAQDMDLPVVAFDLASYNNADFTHAWRRLLSRVPCMALLEDIDSVFLGRKNRLGDEGGGLSFDCLLNCLSGVEGSDGVLVVVTTNRIQDLDPALGVPDENGVSTRPGRIDRVVELLPLDETCRRRIAERVLSDCPDEIDAAVDAGSQETGAQFTDRCIRIALTRYWSGARNGRVCGGAS